jgi:cytochrome c551/c552
MILTASAISAKDNAADEGKAIFTARCTSCHNVNTKVVGPALANVDQRHSIDWIVKFVNSSQSLVKANDKAAVALFNEYNQVVMPDHTDLGKEQIESIISYIKSQTKANAGAESAPFARPGKLLPNYTPIAIMNIGFFGTYLIIVILLVVCMIMAVKVKEIARENKQGK